MADRGTLTSRGRIGTPGASEPTAARGRRLPSAARERRPALAALALLLIVGGALSAAYLVLQSGQRVAAIEIAEPIGAGQRIPLDALRSVQVAVGGGVGYVPWSEADQVAQYYAATAIPAGTLLSNAMVARQANLAVGRDVLGLALKDGQLPSGLAVGDHVVLFQVNDATQSCPGTPGGTLAADAVVLGIAAAPADSGSADTDVAVALDPADAGAVACNAANGAVGVAKLPPTGATGPAPGPPTPGPAAPSTRNRASPGQPSVGTGRPSSSPSGAGAPASAPPGSPSPSAGVGGSGRSAGVGGSGGSAGVGGLGPSREAGGLSPSAAGGSIGGTGPSGPAALSDPVG